MHERHEISTLCSELCSSCVFNTDLFLSKPSRPLQPYRQYTRGGHFQETRKQTTTLLPNPNIAILQPRNCSKISHADKTQLHRRMTQLQKDETWFTVDIPSTVSASFKSFAITRHYSVHMQLRIAIAGKRFRMETNIPLHALSSGCALQGPNGDHEKAQAYVAEEVKNLDSYRYVD